MGNMKNILAFALTLILASQAYAWGYSTGKVEDLYVNAYGNYDAEFLNGGYCFKLTDSGFYMKIAFFDSGERRNNFQLVQSMVMAAKMSGKQLKATYVDWGTDPTCRVSGVTQPAKWLENLQMLD
jgi:hypothetical protein